MAAIRQLLRSATSSSIDKALDLISQKTSSHAPAVQPPDTIDLTHAVWADPEDLTDDFDEKMSAFIAFEDDESKSAQRWLEEG